MADKTFRISWYASQAHFDFAKLTVEEVGFLMQIINLIYLQNGPIENDPEYLSRQFSGMKKAKAKKLLAVLIEKEQVFINFSNKIDKKSCQIELENVQNSRKSAQISGKKGAETRWQNDKKQSLNNSEPINSKMASSSCSNSISTSIYTTTQILEKGLFEKYLEYRKDIDAPLHGKGIEIALEQIQKLHDQGENPNDIIKNTILQGWKWPRSLKNSKEERERKPKRKSNYHSKSNIMEHFEDEQ